MRNIKLLWGMIAVLGVAVLILARLAMFHAQVPAAPQAGLEETIVAKIGGKDIPASKLQENLYQKHGSELLNQMLDREAVRMEAEEQGIAVTDDEINQELKQMMQGYDNKELFYRSMKEQVGLSKEELRDDVRNKLLVEKIATRNITISDQDVEAYIKNHPEEFKNTVQLRVQQIITDSLEQANKTFDLAKSGSDFGTLARERSLDTNTANEGGDLGWVEENDPFVPAPILKAASQLKVGEVSKPIRLDSGYAVIKLKDRREQTKGTPGQIRSSVRKQLALQQAPPLKEIVKSLRTKRNAVILDPKLANENSEAH